MSITYITLIILIVAAGACLQAALGFGTTMITMALLPLLMPYQKAFALSMIAISISTIYVSLKYRKYINWKVMLPFLIPTAIISSIVTILSAKVDSDIMYLLLGIMFIVISIYFFLFSSKIRIRPNVKTGVAIGTLCGVFYGLFASGGPTAAVYFIPALDDKKSYLATIQAFLCVNNLIILTICIIQGRFASSDLPAIGACVIALFAGTFLGLRIFKKIPEKSFSRIIYAFVGIGGLWIIISHLI